MIVKNYQILSGQCALLMIPTILYTIASDNLQAFIVISFLCCLSLVIKKSLSYTTRNCVWLLVFYMLILTIYSQTVKIESRLFMLPEPMFPAFAYAAVCLTFLRQEKTQITAQVIMSLGALMASGDVIDSLDSFQGMSFNPLTGYEVNGEPISTFKFLYLAGIVFVSPLMLYLFRAGRGEFKKLSKNQSIAPILVVVCSVVLVFCFAVSAKVVCRPLVKSASDYFMTIGNRMHRGKDEFSSDRIDLSKSLPESVGKGRSKALLTIKGDGKVEGYYRLNIYDNYEGGTWAREDIEVQLNPSAMSEKYEKDLPVNMNTYSLVKAREVDLQKSSVVYEANFSSENLLHRGNSDYLIVDTRPIEQGIGGSIKYGKKADPRRSYDLYSSDEGNGGAFQGRVIANYLQLPDDLAIREVLRSKGREIFQKANSVEEKVERLQDFFNKNYSYQFGGVKVSEELDPVVDFLQNQSRGHCQYFANASALLLRQQGIPSRYVEGLVIAEKNQFGNFYVGRVRDLHAWVEAYDTDSGRWILVETTVAGGIPSVGEPASTMSSLWQMVKVYFSLVYAAFTQGYVGEALISFFVNIWSKCVWFVKDPLRGSLVVVTVLPALFFFFMRWRKKRLLLKADRMSFIQAEFAAYLKKLEKKSKIRHLDHWTLEEYKCELQKSKIIDYESVEKVIDFYQDLRYSPTQCTDNSIGELLVCLHTKIIVQQNSSS